MRFFLVARDKDSGDMRLLAPTVYDSRQDALDALGAVVAEAGGAGLGDVYLADLDTVIPVVLFSAPVSVPSTLEEPEPVSDTWEQPVTSPPEPEDAGFAAMEGPAAAVEAPSVEAPAMEALPQELTAFGAFEEVEVSAQAPGGNEAAEQADPESGVAALEYDDGSGLADALRRAALRLEDEGIVTPPSVEEYAVTDAPLDPASIAQPEDLRVEETPPVQPSDEVASWPWESAPAADSAVVSDATPETAGVFEPVGIDQPGLEDITLLTPGGSLDETYSLRTVVMGEYAAAADEPVADEGVAAEAPSEPEADDPFAAIEALAEQAAAATDDAAEPDVVPMPDMGGDVEAAVQPVDDDAKAYEPTALDMAGYTCDDCVYVATCPKHHQEGPATCGSFQWKSV